MMFSDYGLKRSEILLEQTRQCSGIWEFKEITTTFWIFPVDHLMLLFWCICFKTQMLAVAQL